VNALSDEFAAEILEAVERTTDPAIRAVVMYGTPHFAAGADIKGFGATQAEHSAGGDADIDPASTLVEAIRLMETLAKPVIAAITGYALGGGLELAMGADFRFAGEGAKVGQPEILLGIIPGAGGTQRLTRLIGLQKSRELNYSGRHVPADEAMELGIVDAVFPDDEVLEAAIAKAKEYATGPTLAIGAAKRAITEGYGRPIAEGMEIEREAFRSIFFTDDAKEGVAAFVEKRKADFSGS
ncbi:MAG: enoyl-CoA hydratase/isomerase family protein, partial [Acidimicrobiia bacterium]|nr:enoyl-CoA hydratase/isomerase family protein [Acidimicrobiia bacterium]